MKTTTINEWRRITRIAIICMCVVLWLTPGFAAEYYITNTATGNDSNPGTSSLPWKTLAPLQAKTLQPGDIVNFARGSVWSKAAWEYVLLIDDNGTSANPITFRSYGSGAKPTFSNGGNRWNKGIKITADYVVIDGLKVENTGYSAFEFTTGADNNKVTNCEVAVCGIAFLVNSSNNLFMGNYIHDLIAVVDDTGPYCTLPKTDPLWSRDPCDNDQGAVSFWLYGPNNEISYNTSVNNRCHSYDYQFDGGFLELYSNCDGTKVHHNWVDKGQGIIESSNGHANNVTISYNVFIENMGLFAMHLSNFTISNFKFENNTVITKLGTLWNDMFMEPTGMIIRNNIFVLGGDASERVGLTNSFTHTNNIYHLLDGAQMGSVTLGTGEIIADPKFKDFANKDFRLQPGSLAINAGASIGYTADFDGTAVPLGPKPEIGAYEYNNLVTNSTFDTNTTGWGIQFNGTGAGSISSVTKTGYSGKACKTTITNKGTAPHHVQVFQAMPVTAGKTYTVKFKASADAARTIGIAFQQNPSPYTTWNSVAGINVTTSAQTFGPFTFNCNTTDATCLFKFMLGNNASAVYIDDVEISVSAQKSQSLAEPLVAAENVFEGLEIKVYPNPATDILKADVPATVGEQIVLGLYDLQGRLLLSNITLASTDGANMVWLNMLPLPTGTYVLRVTTGTRSKSVIVVKQN